jgi:hypothetical protein
MLKNSQLPLSPAGPFDSYITPAGVDRGDRGRAKRHISGVGVWGSEDIPL